MSERSGILESGSTVASDIEHLGKASKMVGIVAISSHHELFQRLSIRPLLTSTFIVISKLK